ncbi:uncharacterized protein LOC101537141 isoform X2 [Sorex araneus]|uniref:uncharacterized protein LOC101537141 isoform X2 n=1 Tax=Sorex araneus TaxID=42254 RepID=UPI0024335AA6|nr:uncharacterized protein LOC101537141 isoform X2 [Sorex araneus]
MQRDSGQAAVSAPAEVLPPRTSVIQSCQDSAAVLRQRVPALGPGDRQEQEENPRKKRKGGWPKGKKRRPASDHPVPHAPSTGYVLFLNEQRTQLQAQHPDLPFPEITRMLAAQWAQLSWEQKQKYMSEADEDKPRCVRELPAPQGSEASQAFQLAPPGGAAGSEPHSEGLSFSTAERAEGSGPHCRTCSWALSSPHSKKEYLLGRQLRLDLTGGFEADPTEFSQHPEPLAEGRGQSRNRGGWAEDAEGPQPLLLGPLGPGASGGSFDLCFLQEFIFRLLKNKDHELQALRKSLEKAQEEQEALQALLGQLQSRRQSLEQELAGLRAYGLVLEKELESVYRARALWPPGLPATFTA